MDYWTFHDRIVAALTELMPRGEYKKAREALDLRPSWLRDIRNRKQRLPMSTVFKILNFYVKDPPSWLYMASKEPEQPPVSTDKPRGWGPTIDDLPTDHSVRVLGEFSRTRLFGSVEPVPECHSTVYLEIRETAQVDPRIVVGRMPALMSQEGTAFIPRLWSVYGTALRRLAEQDAAHAAFALAEEFSYQNADWWALADCWQRWARLWLDKLQCQKALNLARLATAEHFRIGNKEGQGRAVFAQGVILTHMNRFDDAIEAFEVARDVLPLYEKSHIQAALLNLAYCNEAKGDLDAAFRWASQLEATSSSVELDAKMLQGRFLQAVGDWEQASTLYQEAFEGFLEKGQKLEAATAAPSYCLALSCAGHPEKIASVVNLCRAIVLDINDEHAASILSVLIMEQEAGRSLTTAKLQHLLSDLNEAGRQTAARTNEINHQDQQRRTNR